MNSNSRERILAILVGVVIVGYIGYSGIMSFVVSPYRELISDIDDARDELNQLTQQQAQLPKKIDEWQTWTAQTLALDAEDAQSALRDDLNDLLLSAGLTNPDFSRLISQRHLLYNNRGAFQEVIVPVTVTGRYSQLVTFLRSFYNQGYLSSLRDLNVKVKRTTSRSRRNATAATTEPTLDISMRASALIFPPVPSTVARSYDPNAADDNRLGWPSDFYAKLQNANVFKKWVKPTPPPEKTTPVKTTPVKTTPVKPPPAKVIPPPNPPERTLVGTENFGGRYFAYVRDDADLANPLMQVSIGDGFDDGELLFVDRAGVVVRGPEKRSHKPDEEQQVDWFYPLGATYAERARLTRASNPRVFTDFQATQSAADEPAGGIGFRGITGSG